MIDDLARLTPDLHSLGWSDDLDRWAEQHGPPVRGREESGSAGAQQPDSAEAEQPESSAAVLPGRLARVSRGFSVVFTGGDAVLAASASIRGQVDTEPATGDFVLLAEAEDEDDGGLVLDAIAPRRTALERRASGRQPEPQVLAANIDLVFVMHSLDNDLNIRRIERQLVVAWDSGATPVVILTKADLEDRADEAVAQVEAIAPEVEVMATSVKSGRNLDRVAGLVRNRTAAMLGLSGIGKSSLVNALTGGVVQRIGEVRTTDGRGRHTTVTRDLIPLPDGGLLIDTPGVREIGLWQARVGLARTFPEVAEAAERCRFADCEHQNEPGCMVRAGIEDGTIETRRVEHWNDLQAELALQDEQLEEWARRAESRDRAEAERRRDDERSNTKRRSRSDSRRKQQGSDSRRKQQGRKGGGKKGKRR